MSKSLSKSSVYYLLREHAMGFESESEKYLEIARLLRQHAGEKGVASFICKSLSVSGRDLGKVKRMMNKGVIAFDDEGNPYFTISFDDAKRSIRSAAEDTAVAEDTVVGTVKEAIAGETRTMTEQYLILGKAIWQAVATHFSKKGISPQELRNMPIHQIIIDALEKADRCPKLENKIRDLEGELAMYRKEVDPMYRLKESCRLIVEFMRTASLAKIAGFNPYAMLPYYQDLIDRYMKGY